MENKTISSPFCSCCAVPVVHFTETDFIHYMEVEEVGDGYDPKKPSEFLIEKKVEEYERIPIDDFINSFASKVGLKNELKGIITKSQMDDFIETHKAKKGFVDLTKLPDTELGMKQLSDKLDSIWADIPSELKDGLTKDEFIKTMTADKLKAYVLSKMPKKEQEGDK